ncbi:hypothetical protein MRX96_053767, partial [Rhipicephalus microplus]
GGAFPGWEVPCPACELDRLCSKDGSARGRKTWYKKEGPFTVLPDRIFFAANAQRNLKLPQL